MKIEKTNQLNVPNLRNHTRQNGIIKLKGTILLFIKNKDGHLAREKAGLMPTESK
jgi:hypothetical protein